ncbi:MAG: hypothetical protein ABI895_21500 [Deltaproteobacteria bacterium]
MHAKHNLRRTLWTCLLAWGCGGTDVRGEQAEAASAAEVAARAEPMGSLSSEEIERLAYDFKHGEMLPDQHGDSLAQMRRLSPEDLRRFRVALADLSPMDGMMREMYEAYTKVLYEHRVFMLDAGPELEEKAMRRAFAKNAYGWPPEVVEQAVQHVLREGMPPDFRRPAH